MKYFLGITTLALLGWIGYRVHFELTKTVSQRSAGILAVPVRLERVREGPVRNVRKFTGTLAARYNFTVAPKITGRIVEITVQAGDRVERGQVIARLDDDELRLVVEEVEAALVVAQANLAQTQAARDLAATQFERAKNLRERGGGTEERLQVAESDLAVKEAQHRVSTAQVATRDTLLRAAKVRLDHATIRADWEPIAPGDTHRYVGERFADEGALLRANDPICSILHTDSLVATIQVPERDYPRLNSGMRVNLAVTAYPGETFGGTIRSRPVELSSSSRQARVEVDVPNPRDGEGRYRLAPGMFVEAEVIYVNKPSAPRIPVSALRYRGEGLDRQAGVYVAEPAPTDGSGAESGPSRPPGTLVARFFPLELGYEDLPWVEITGAIPHAPFVAEGHQNLLDGVPVRVSSQEELD